MQVRTLCRELPARAGQQVHLEGWVHRIRDFGGVRFVVLRDRTGHGQIVLSKGTDLGDVNCEWVVAIDGMCRLEPRAPDGVEVAAEAITHDSACPTAAAGSVQPEKREEEPPGNAVGQPCC